MPGLKFRFEVLGFNFQGFGFLVPRLRVEDLGLRVPGLGLWVSGSGSRVWGSGLSQTEKLFEYIRMLRISSKNSILSQPEPSGRVSPITSFSGKEGAKGNLSAMQSTKQLPSKAGNVRQSRRQLPETEARLWPQTVILCRVCSNAVWGPLLSHRMC